MHCFPLNAQTSGKLEPNIGMDLVSRYIWRGVLLSNGAAFQPFMEWGNDRITLGAWGSATVSPFAFQETDLYFNVHLGRFSLGLVDYFTYAEQEVVSDFFNWRVQETGHVLEFLASYETEGAFPLKLSAGYNLLGADELNTLHFTAQLSRNTGPYNTSFELGYTPTRGYYHETKRGITHAGIQVSKDLVVSESLSLPFQVGLVFNPMYNQLYMVAVLGIISR